LRIAAKVVGPLIPGVRRLRLALIVLGPIGIA
jgi:hypothetical protein